MQTKSVLAALLIAAIATPQIAEAKKLRFGGVRSAANGVKTYGYRDGVYTMKIEELVSCLRTESALDDASRQIDRDEIELKVLSNGLETSLSKINRSELTLDRYSQVSIDQHNQLIDQFEAQRGHLNSRVDAFNANIDLLKGSLEAWNEECSGKFYYEDDFLRAQNILTAN